MRSLLLTIAATLLSAATTVSAVGKAYVVNQCDFDVSVWSVGGSIAGPWRLSARGGAYSETFVRDPQSGGKALKVTIPADGLYSGAPQSVFAYSLDGANVWYDLSDVFGDPFKGKKLVVTSVESSCPAIVWPNGTPPAGSQVKVCTSEKDVRFILCAY